MLHHLGLACTRVTGSLMVSLGFLMLSFTTAATPDYLWGATILLSVGGNTIRMATLQFANLFPEARNTAMAILSGIFTPSAAVLMLLQTMYEGGMEWNHVCWTFVAASSLVLLATPFIPRHHIPLSLDPEDESESKGKEVEEKDSANISESIFSISSMLHAYWLFINFFAVNLFTTHFNSWINKFSANEAEAGHYSRLFGMANILCVLVTPLPGLTTDLLAKHFRKGKSGIMQHVAMLQAMIPPMVAVNIAVITQTTMLLLKSPWAVYVGLLCLAVNRPSCLSVGNPFVRARFPADHFNRLIGIQGTVLSILTFVQYPHFTWAQRDYNMAFGVMLGALVLSFSHPLHLFSKTYLKRTLQPQAEA